MVIVRHVQCLSFFALVCVSLQARALPDYHLGDKASQDIVADVPFDVVDEQATENLKESRAQTIAAIYHQINGATNVMARDFLRDFARAHLNFSNSIAATYHQPAIDNSTIEASDFGYLITAYNVEHKKFPVTTELAVTWARGNPGNAIRDKWLGILLHAMSHPVQPDAAPADFVYGKKVRVMPVANANEKFTFNQAWRTGHIVSLDNIAKISMVRAKFREQFAGADQPVAAALAQYLQPDCFPDVAITKAARDYSVRQIVVSDHFDAGQVIVSRGEQINAQTMAALDSMRKAMVPGTLSQQVAVEQEHAQQEDELAQQEQHAALLAQQAAQAAQQQQEKAQLDSTLARSLADKERAQAEQERARADAMHEEALNAQTLAQQVRARYEWMAGALATVSVLALLIVWRAIRYQRVPQAPVKLQRFQPPAPAATELAPYLAQTLKEALVQGLAAQRAELLEAQRLAAAEIAELVHRLDRLQAPMQERVRAYQDRIQELQKELAERTAENRELLKLKIEMMRQQIDTERGRVGFN